MRHNACVGIGNADVLALDAMKVVFEKGKGFLHVRRGNGDADNIDTVEPLARQQLPYHLLAPLRRKYDAYRLDNQLEVRPGTALFDIEEV